MKQKEVAKKVDISSQHLNRIIHGRGNASPELAKKLEKVTGVSREHWVWGNSDERKAPFITYKQHAHE